jgi:replicative DNA helicase
MKTIQQLESLEVAVIGTIAKHPETFRQIRGILRPEMFSTEHGREIAAILWPLMSGKFNPNIFIANASPLHARMVESAMPAADPDNLSAAAELLAASWQDGRYYQAMTDVAMNRNTFSDWREADALLSEAKREILQNATGKARSRDEVLGGLVDDVMDGVLHGKTHSGVSTGFEDLDDLTGGYRPGQMVVVGARPGMGKTRFAVQQCLQAAKQGHPTVLYSMEMGAEEIYRVAMSWMTRIPVGRMLTYNLSAPYETDELAKAAKLLKEWPFFVVDDVYTIEDMDFSMDELHQKEGIRLFVADYIQLLNKSTARRSDNRNNELAAISRACKQMARRTGASGIILSQLSREIDKRASRRPVLADLRDSGAIEADADVVIFLHNPAVVDEKSEDPCELIVSKQRNGRLGAVLATWEEHGFYVPLADNDATHGRAYSNEAPAIPGAWNEPKINGVKPKDEEYVPF